MNPAHEIRDDGGPVVYFFNVDDTTYHGWRRGIQWGEQEITVVYSPLLPRGHLTSVRPGLASGSVPPAGCTADSSWATVGRSGP